MIHVKLIVLPASINMSWLPRIVVLGSVTADKESINIVTTPKTAISESKLAIESEVGEVVVSKNARDFVHVLASKLPKM